MRGHSKSQNLNLNCVQGAKIVRGLLAASQSPLVPQAAVQVWYRNGAVVTLPPGCSWENQNARRQDVVFTCQAPHFTQAVFVCPMQCVVGVSVTELCIEGNHLGMSMRTTSLAPGHRKEPASYSFMLHTIRKWPTALDSCVCIVLRHYAQ